MVSGAQEVVAERTQGGEGRIRVHLFFRRAVPGEHFSIERLFRAIAVALSSERYEVRCLVCPFESKGVLRRAASVLWAALRQGDINHITGDVNFLGLLMSRRRTILTVQDSASMKRLSGWRRAAYRLFWVQLPLARAGHVTVASTAVLKETEEWSGRAGRDISVIPHCVPQSVKPTPRAFSGERPRILAIGTRPNKNLVRIIQALRGVSCTLAVVGSLTDAHRDEIVRTGVEVDNVEDITDVEISEEYAHADLVIFVSTYEGFGLPILEAQAAGRPLITSRRAPMQDVAGEGSCLVDPEDVGEIRRAVLRMLNDGCYRESVVQAGLKNAERYSPGAVAARYAALYEEMLAALPR